MALLRTLVLGGVRAATRSKLLAHALFGVDFRPLDEDETYFDVTTPVLVREAARRLNRSSRVLDLGTGPVAVIGLALWNRLGCHVISADVNPESVRLAQTNVDRNRAPVRVVESTFFDAIDQDFDAVVFNPPYVPTETGKRRGLSARFRRQWDGGPDGLAVIDAFLTAVAADGREPLVLMGVNHKHTPRGPLTALLGEHPNLRTEDVYRHPLLPVDVYVLRKRARYSEPRPPVASRLAAVPA